jgi:hypothetical protein
LCRRIVVVDQRALEGLDIFLQRLALGRHRAARGLVVGHHQRDRPTRCRAGFCSTACSAMAISWRMLPGPGRLQQMRRLLRRQVRGGAAVFLGEGLGIGLNSAMMSSPRARSGGSVSFIAASRK